MSILNSNSGLNGLYDFSSEFGRAFMEQTKPMLLNQIDDVGVIAARKYNRQSGNDSDDDNQDQEEV